LSDGVVTLSALTPADTEPLVQLDDEQAQWAFSRGPRTAESAARLIAKTRGQWQRGSVRRRWAIRVGEPPVLAGTLIMFPRDAGQVVEFARADLAAAESTA